MRKLEVGKKYRHFKGLVVDILMVAKDSEDLKEMVVYKHEDTNEIWVRPLSMFLEETDVSKRKDNVTGQKYRFELIED